jgi:enoyl-CoA hydratase
MTGAAAMPAEPTVLVERRDHILLITINRPAVKNAVDVLTALQIEAAIDLLDETDDLFIGVITGAGGTFSPGADLRAVQEFGPSGPPIAKPSRGGFGIFRRPPRKPLIAAVEGYAVGGGMELALACDLVVAAETARFGLPEVRHNVIAVGGGLFRLPRRVPYHIAMEMALSGKPWTAVVLERWGLINRLTPAGGALEAALDLADSLLENGPTALAATKQIIRESASWATEEEAWEKQGPIAEVALNAADRTEGINAFFEKRKPVWTGR